jgi:hypothetical protein
MKMMRLFLPACLLLIGASTAFAQGGPDPKIIMGGSGSCQSFDETSLTETFTNVKTGCVVDFTNDITSDSEVPNVTLDILVANVDTPFSGALSCALGAGAPLNTAFVSSPTSCTFEDETLLESITPGSTYSLSFVNPCAVGCGFPSLIDITLAPVVIPTPEPATTLLLGVGLAVLLAGRKWLKVGGIGVVSS